MITVTSCTFLKEWTGKDGKTGKIYDVVFTDGSKGQSFTEIPNGTSKDDLEVTPNGNYPDKIKMKAKNGFGGRSASKPNNGAFAMSYAKDLVVADKVKIDQLIATADKIYNWIESKAK